MILIKQNAQKKRKYKYCVMKSQHQIWSNSLTDKSIDRNSDLKTPKTHAMILRSLMERNEADEED